MKMQVKIEDFWEESSQGESGSESGTYSDEEDEVPLAKFRKPASKPIPTSPTSSSSRRHNIADKKRGQ